MDVLLWMAMFTDKRHIFYRDEDDECWQRLKSRIELVKLGKDKELIQNYKKLAAHFSTLASGVSKGSTYGKGFNQNFMSKASLVYYAVRGTKKLVQQQFFYANPSVYTCQAIFNTAERGLERSGMEALGAKVKFHCVIQVPKTQPIITLQNVDDLPEVEDWEAQMEDTQVTEASSFKMQSDTSFDLHTDGKSFVQIRVLCSQDLPIRP